MRINPTRQDFIDAIQANYALASVTALRLSRLSAVHYETADDHAAHAIELIANRAGLRPLVTQADGAHGLTYHVTVRGFSKVTR